MEFKHTSVLFEETMENLDIRPEGTYLDGTLGLSVLIRMRRPLQRRERD